MALTCVHPTGRIYRSESSDSHSMGLTFMLAGSVLFGSFLGIIRAERIFIRQKQLLRPHRIHNMINSSNVRILIQVVHLTGTCA